MAYFFFAVNNMVSPCPLEIIISINYHSDRWQYITLDVYCQGYMQCVRGRRYKSIPRVHQWQFSCMHVHCACLDRIKVIEVSGESRWRTKNSNLYELIEAIFSVFLIPVFCFMCVENMFYVVIINLFSIWTDKSWKWSVLE